MKKKLHVGTSPLTNTIYAGTLIEHGTAWGAGTQDVTIDALVAVAQHVHNFGKPVEIRNVTTGDIEYRITVEKMLEDSQE